MHRLTFVAFAGNLGLGLLQAVARGRQGLLGLSALAGAALDLLVRTSGLLLAGDSCRDLLGEMLAGFRQLLL